MNRDITFISKGLRCAGRLFIPAGANAQAKAPAIVMGPGLAAVKEQGLLSIARRFSAAGFAALAFDYRHFGGSEGEPRSQVFPDEMVEDYLGAVTCICEQPGIDPGRIGIWGTSYSGALVLRAGAVDRRVRAVAAQAPSVLNRESRRAMNPQLWERMEEFLRLDRERRAPSGEVTYMKVVSAGDEPCILPGEEAYRSYMAIRELAPGGWQNRVTVESFEKIRAFDPVRDLHAIAALLMIPAEKDSYVPLRAVTAAFESAREPKAMNVLPVNHFEIYSEPWNSQAIGLAIDWFRAHL